MKFSKCTLCLALTMLMFNSTFASEFLDGKITLVDGKEYKGLVRPPINQWAMYVEYKDYEEGEIEKFKTSLIKEVLVISNGVTSRFLRLKVKPQPNDDSTSVEDYKYLSPLWLIEKVSGYASLFAQVASWKFVKSGEVKLYSGSADGAKDIRYFGIKAVDSIPKYLAFLSYNSHGQLKDYETHVSQFVAEYRELVDRIQSGEFEPSEVAQIIEIYNDWKKQK